MSTLQNLPDDAKRLICAELYREGKELVRPLWTVSKAWRVVTESFVYRDITLAPAPVETLYEDVQIHEYARKHLEHVRCIRIFNYQHGTEERIKSFCTGLNILPSSFSLVEPMFPKFNEVFLYDFDQDREKLQKSWEPLLNLLPQFKHLTDIVVQTHIGLPPGLLAELEKSHPKCRLHLRNFRFKSLRKEVTDPDEHALVTSPSLHSLSIKYMYRDSNGNADYNQAAALCTIALAPNLKHVRMLGCRPASSPALYRTRGQPIQPWKGFLPPIERPKHAVKTKLESLSFAVYNDRLSLERLKQWEGVADLSTVEAFSCSIGTSSVLHHLAISKTFSSLKDLTLSLQPSKRDDLSGLESAVEEFFASLNPLQSLSLSGTLHGSLLQVVAERHGETLEKLVLNPFSDGYDMPSPPLRVTAKDMEMLAAACLKLTTLSLTLKRSMGDRTETRCYEAIGTLRNLKTVKLNLDCANPGAWSLSPESDWDEFDRDTQTGPGSNPKYWNGHLKRAMVNSALDENLARQIYTVMNSNRTKNSLENLTLKTYGGSGFGNVHPGDLSTIVSHLSRTYRVTRAHQEQKTGKVEVDIVEIGKEEREQRDIREREWDKNSRGGAWNVFRHIWPRVEDENWRNVWKSWPLQLADGSGYATQDERL